MTLTPATAEAPDDVDMFHMFKALEWTEDVLWDLTGLPDTFADILLHCKGIFYDEHNALAHQAVALELLGFTNSAKSLFDANGPDMLQRAIESATTSAVFASTLASISEAYYFLRALDAFALDDISVNELAKLLLLDDQGAVVACTHADVASALDACLSRLDVKYPGIRLYANCAMLEANIAQEFGTSHEHLYSLRSELPVDGNLYMAILKCIIECARENMTCSQVVNKARCLFVGAKSEYWPTVASFIFELQGDDDGDGVDDAIAHGINNMDISDAPSNAISVTN
ncbi:hypothetical protein GGI02_003511 [Coemansia sp. RSA 2322]|nr:hypothetical protein GGI02_003511 [Coemansia sp. RSA 2322]